jgi:acyl carrier protein
MKAGASIEAQVKEIAADILRVPARALHLDSGPENIPQWESIAMVNLVLALEQRFERSFDPEEIARMHTIGDIVRLIEGDQKQP